MMFRCLCVSLHVVCENLYIRCVYVCVCVCVCVCNHNPAKMGKKSKIFITAMHL